jgi:DNA-binding NarL/FixJ family response regulator
MGDSCRVVLADDHTVLRVGMRAFLEEQTSPRFVVVGEASSGEEAVALVEQHKPDLLLLDLSMPNLGGLETTIEIRRRGSRVRILVLTQHAEGVSLRRLLEAGAEGYILKTARGDELLAAVRAVRSGGTYVEPSLAGTLVAEALGDQAPTSEEEAYARLTPRERQVLKLVADGQSNKEIATTLDVAVKTVMAHRANLMEKINIRNRSRLIQFAIRMGLLQVPRPPEDG